MTDRLEAALRPDNDKIEVLLANRTGHPETFHVSGVLPDEVFLTLDGNTRYSANLSPDPRSAIVEVRHGGEEGELLAYRELDRPEEPHGS